MPDVAKVLPFRPRVSASACSREEATARARAFLTSSISDRTQEVVDEAYSDGDVLAAICAQLVEVTNSSPSNVSDEAPVMYQWLSAKPASQFFFDERDFFLGETALLAAGSCRLLGRREEAERWLDRADASFRHTVAPAPHLARVAYNRLALRYDMGRYDEVTELVPSVALSFDRLGMESDRSKTQFLEAISLKALGRLDEARAKFTQLAMGEDSRVQPAIRAMALVHLGDLHSTQGFADRALAAYTRALPILESERRFYAVADLRAALAVTLRQMGRLSLALEAFQEAVNGHVALGMRTRAAYVRILLSEALLEAGRPREAEWQILAALPTIDEESMIPEGFAAIALLRESVRQRKTDPKALLEVRAYLEVRN